MHYAAIHCNGNGVPGFDFPGAKGSTLKCLQMFAGLKRGMAQAGLLAEDQACQPITRPGDQYDNQVHHECDDDNYGEYGDGG